MTKRRELFERVVRDGYSINESVFILRYGLAVFLKRFEVSGDGIASHFASFAQILSIRNTSTERGNSNGIPSFGFSLIDGVIRVGLHKPSVAFEIIACKKSSLRTGADHLLRCGDANSR